jgi:putative ABC transport system permease protein
MLMHDLNCAFRTLTRRPGFAAVGILLLALGAGANAAVLSVVRSVLLRPLPFAAPDELVAISPGEFMSNDDMAFLRARATRLAQVASISPGWLMAFSSGDDPARKITAARVSGNLFTMAGVTAALGRTLLDGDSAPGRERVAVLSDALWRQQFAASPAAIGWVVQIDQVPHEVVGVLPAGFELLGRADLWIPAVYAPGAPAHRQVSALLIARLRGGTNPDLASGELAGLVPEMRREQRKSSDWGHTMRAVPLRDSITGTIRPALVLLLAAVGCVLLLGAVNLGTLVLGGAVARSRELAVRRAVGASTAHVVRQLLVEQALLALGGSVAGTALAWAAFPSLLARIPADVPRQGEIALDWVVFVTITVATVCLSLVLAVVPAIIGQRSGVQPLLRQHGGGPAPHRALGGLVAAQVALAIVLGAGASLMLRSLWNLQHVDPGFAPDHVLTFRLQSTSSYQSLKTGVPYLRLVTEQVGALPGVSAVGAINHLPMSGYSWSTRVHRPEEPPAPGTEPPLVAWRFVAADYFGAMRIPLLAGRGFADSDTDGSAGVAIVNARLARDRFGSVAAALGQRLIQQGGGRPGPFEVEIVGIVGDVRHLRLDAPPAPEIYRPLQQTFMFPMQMVVRTSGDPGLLAAAVRDAASGVDKSVPVADMQTLPAVLGASLGRPRLLALLLSLFAAIGVVLSVVGLHGVVALRVSQGAREIGVRMALGASPGSIAAAVVGQGLAYAAGGLLCGIPLAWALTRVMRSVLFEVTAGDPVTIAVLPLLLAGVTAAACYIPARRAARVDPVQVIRSQQ